jgi:hypothetical protein
MNLKTLEEAVLKHTIGTLFAIPVALFGILWLAISCLVPDDIKNQPMLRIMAAVSLLLLLSVAVCVAYIILLKRKLKDKPDFSQFTHDPDKACWINKTTDERICEACKTEGKLTPLSKFGHGWKCPLHPDVVDYKTDDNPPDNPDWNALMG